jgi:hypothetical protein
VPLAGLIRDNQSRVWVDVGVAGDRNELPFSVHLAILFKVYRMTLGFHSVLSFSPLALPSTSARENRPAGVSDGMDFGSSASMSASKLEIFCK